MPHAPLPKSAYIAVDHDLPCRNPHCSQHGEPHVGCRCYQATGGPNYANYEPLAKGGIVHYCSQGLPHHPNCPLFASGGEVESNLQFQNDPSLAVDHAIALKGLHHVLTKTGHSKSPDPHMAHMEYVKHSKEGSKRIEDQVKKVFDKDRVETNPEHVEALQNHLNSIQQDPDQLMNVAGSIGNTMPDHAAAIAAKAAITSNYLNSIKPLGQQGAAMDPVIPPSRMEQMAYERQVQLAQQPLSILNHIKSGTIQPTDLITLNTLYPKLAQSIQGKSTEALINAKVNKTKVSYSHKQGLSALLGQPLDSTQTPMAAQAIIKANAPQAIAPPSAKGNRQGAKGNRQGATAATQETIAKTDALYETPDQARLMNRKS